MSELPEAVLMDLDDTILDDSSAIDASWSDACANVARLVDGLEADALNAAIREYASWWWSDAERNRRGRLELRWATREIVSEALVRLGHERPEVAHEIADAYRDLREERSEMHDGALETIEWFRERGVKLGMMTNGGAEAQRTKIERFALAPYFDHIVVEGEAGYGKPDPRVYETLLGAMNVAPAKTWAVGDNLEADVFGPMSMGIHGIWVDRNERGLPEGETRRPDRTIRALRELVP